jgi:predicted RNase H-like nuclease (RuvC/YqgF family)
MFGLPKLYAGIGISLLLLVTIGGLTISRNYWKAEALDEREQKYVVTASIGKSLGNPKLKWKDVAEQVDRYASGHNQLVADTDEANRRLGELGDETKRLKALNAELRAKAKVEIQKRNRLIDRLENAALTPGDATNVQEQLAACVAALNSIYEEGL